MMSEVLRSRLFSGCVHAALWLLLVLVITGVGGKRPDLREWRPDSTTVTTPVPVAKLATLFPSPGRTKPVAEAHSRNPFETTYFIPQTTPPPSPTTRTIELTYQGFYQTGNDPKRAMIRFGDALVSVPLGGSVATNLFVASVTATNLTLTNKAVAGQSTVLVLNTKKEIEIPIR